ncbi:MAG: aminoacyl-tRNA hydrolase [Gammaproteobacteria bacterium]|jgi:PTH1 family peptidyl-tRNA hydrolase|nr:aminoacyl-tRNA hydrolase [Gammaproteobacteria bacterium]
MSSIQLIVGLGNPGSQYQNTRHNAGAWFVEALAESHHIKLSNEKRFRGRFAQLNSEHGKVALLVPETFMNLSGDAVVAAANYYHIKPQNILVVHDELDLACGRAQLKLGGGPAGHNGLRDIIQKLGTKDFWRLRIGIARPPALFQQSVADYVLSKPSAQDLSAIEASIEKSLSVCELLFSGQLDKAMQKLHSA